MKMSGVFDLPLNSDFDTVSDRNRRDLATFDTCKEDDAAVHAINNHDKLVEALDSLIFICSINLDNHIDRATSLALIEAKEALKQAKSQ